jgi:hypothetical protein
MVNPIRRYRSAAPAARLGRCTPPDLSGRRRLVEACRAELAWAREDWAEVAGRLGIAIDADHGRRGPAAWEADRLPHEQAAARLLNVWGHLHPVEHRLRASLSRLKAQRRARWDGRAAGTLEDLRWYRVQRARLWPAFLAAGADYRQQRATLGWPIRASVRDDPPLSSPHAPRDAHGDLVAFMKA